MWVIVEDVLERGFHFPLLLSVVMRTRLAPTCSSTSEDGSGSLVWFHTEQEEVGVCAGG